MAKDAISQYLELVNPVKGGTHRDTLAYNQFWTLLNPSKWAQTTIQLSFYFTYVRNPKQD